jgi:hypothetical protein
MRIEINKKESEISIYEIDLEHVFWIEDILRENNIAYDKIWRSKYNSYVVYESEPFCCDGFRVEIAGSCSEIGNIIFSYQLITKRYEDIIKLDTLLKLEV